MKYKKFIGIGLILISIVLASMAYTYTGSLAFPNKVLAKPEPLTSISCTSGYEYMQIFTECSDTLYVKSGFDNCAWNTWSPAPSGCHYYNPVCWKCSSTQCGNCGQEGSQPPICPSGYQWNKDRITCPTSGRCSSASPVGLYNCPTTTTTTTTTPTTTTSTTTTTTTLPSGQVRGELILTFLGILSIASFIGGLALLIL